MKIEHNGSDIKLSQGSFVVKLLELHGMHDCNGTKYPIELVDDTNDESLVDIKLYQSLVGAFIFLSNCTRPDISFAVGCLARKMSCPSMANLEQAKHLLRYLKGTSNNGICFKKQPLSLHGFCDASWSVKSTSGYIFYGNGPLSWNSKVQHTPSLSST